MIELNTPQCSEEWFTAKAGIPGASSFHKIVTSKGEPSKQATDYAYTLAGERITGQKVETHQSAAMLRGAEMEAEARELFEFTTDLEVRQTGIIFSDKSRQYLCSPDGVIDEQQAGLEVKCPLMHTHIKYLLAGKLPTDYVQQVQGSMLVTGFQVWHFFSYYPGLPPLHIEVERDEKLIGKMGQELERFCALVDGTVNKLKKVSA